MNGNSGNHTALIVRQCALLAALTVPQLALAQASPFLTGATAIQTNILAWLTPIAIILVMVLGAMAMANRISWGWCIAAIIGMLRVCEGLRDHVRALLAANLRSWERGHAGSDV